MLDPLIVATVDIHDTESMIRNMAPPYLAELSAMVSTLGAHVTYYEAKGLSSENSTSFEDCALLYLLIRHFNRRSIFEVGTYVGTTAVAMNEAARLNGGTCTTCDPVNCDALQPGSGIRFLHEPSNLALARLRSERQRIDFAFFDWIPDDETLALANKVFTSDAILAVHDYKLNPKGEEIVDAINRRYSRISDGKWFFPSLSPVEVAPGFRVNVCTAFWIPDPPRSGVAKILAWRRLLSSAWRPRAN